MNWHVHDDTLDAYTSGRIDDASALSVEAHVLSCAACRHTLAGGVDPVRRDRIWNEIEDAIDAPRAGIAERVLIAFGVRAHVARLVVTAPSLGSAWLLAVAASLIFAAIASRAIADDPMPFLIRGTTGARRGCRLSVRADRGPCVGDRAGNADRWPPAAALPHSRGARGLHAVRGTRRGRAAGAGLERGGLAPAGARASRCSPSPCRPRRCRRPPRPRSWGQAGSPRSP